MDQQHSPEKLPSPNLAPSTSAHHSQATHHASAQREQTRVKMENMPSDGGGMPHRGPSNGIHMAVPQLLQVRVRILTFFRFFKLFCYRKSWMLNTCGITNKVGGRRPEKLELQLNWLFWPTLLKTRAHLQIKTFFRCVIINLLYYIYSKFNLFFHKCLFQTYIFLVEIVFLFVQNRI
jgi:hypothetical protein